MHFLSFLLTFVIAMTLSNAQCFYEPIRDKLVSNKKGCFRDGEMHDFGVYWYTKDCLRCYCTREIVACCNIAVTPVGYDQEKCESVFDVESCSYQTYICGNSSEDLGLVNGKSCTKSLWEWSSPPEESPTDGNLSCSQICKCPTQSPLK